VICALIKKYDDKDILVDCCWALSNLCEGGGKRVMYLLEQGILPNLVHLLGYVSFPHPFSIEVLILPLCFLPFVV
jgi:hypothetical protein